MFDIVHRVGIKAPVAKVYAALATIEGVAAWWTQDTTGVSKPGGSIEFSFFTPSGEKVGTIGVNVIALGPDKDVRWRVTSGPEEWIGTELIFKLRQDDAYTIALPSCELARGGRVHRPLQHEVGDVPAEPEGPPGNRQRPTCARRPADR